MEDAVITLLEPRSPYRPWRSADIGAEPGDPVVFVLDTDPTTVVANCAYGAHPASRFGHTSAAAARTILRLTGRCHGCEETIDLTGPDARNQVFVHTVDPYVRPDPESSRTTERDARDWPAVLCRRCRDRMRAEHRTSVVDFKFAMHPACPECGARQTRETFYGMPSDPSNVPPWSNIGGCCPTPRQWCCGKCWHEW